MFLLSSSLRSLRSLQVALSATALLVAAPVAASELGIRTSPGRPAQLRDGLSAADRAASAKAAAAASVAAAAAATPPRRTEAGSDSDTLDDLRDRLARKLGNRMAAPEGDESGVLRVVARPARVPVAPIDARRANAKPAPKKKPHPAHWSYSGDGGPEHWGELKPEYSLCNKGKRQSPIDIRDGILVQLDPVQFDYRPTQFRVVDTGHTVQVNMAAGNSIEVMGRRYELREFHFHRPSEERIDGRQFDMVAHLVHSDMEGRTAIVAVLLDRGSVQPVVQQVWNNLPLEKGDEVIAKALIDLNGLLPADRGYFTYMGSISTPPCSEGVLWMVMQNPVSVSPAQIGIFSRLYPMNARPVQSSSGRLIKGSD